MGVKDLLILEESLCKKDQQSFSDEKIKCQYQHPSGFHSHEGQSSKDSDLEKTGFQRMMLSQLCRERDPIRPEEKERIAGCLCHLGLIEPQDDFERLELQIL